MIANMMLGKDFSVVTPYFLTASGSFAVAADTRFCASTVFISGSVPTSKEMSITMVPSLALVDFK